MNPRKQLKLYRDQNLMSVVELAAKVGCSPQFIYALEDGKVRDGKKPKVPGLLLAERIELVTGVPRAAWDRIVRVNHHRPIRRRTA